MPTATRDMSMTSVQVVNDPALQRYDEVEVLMELYLKLYDAEYDAQRRHILVKFMGTPVFDSYKLHTITRINDQLYGDIIVFVNNSNLVEYEDNFTVTAALVRPVASVPLLSDIYVEVSPEVYSVLDNKDKASLLSRFMLYSDIFGINDVVRDLNGRVILCEPVSQGKITSDTNIYIIREGAKPVKEAKKEVSFDLSNYLSSLLNLGDEYESKKLPVSVLRERVELGDLWTKEDQELFIFVNTADISWFGFPIFNGDSIVLNAGTSKIKAKIFTFIEPNTFESGHIYLSPILLINLGLSVGDSVGLEPLAQKDINVSNLVPLAKSLTISRIASPITLDKTYQQQFFLALKTLFNSSFRVLRSGDVVPVTIDSIIAKTMFDLGTEDEVIPTGDPDSVAWFRITGISGEEAEEESEAGQFLIDPLKTRMILSGVEHTSLPPNGKFHWYDYLGLPPLFRYQQHFDYAKTLKKILITNSSRNLKTTILLNSMSRGLGKTTVLRSITTELGINLVELDCINFINPGSELKTIGLISGNIDKLLSVTPESDKSTTVVYLKHIEALCPDTNDSEPNYNIHVSLALKLIQLINNYFKERPNIIFAFSSNDIDKVNSNIRSTIKFQITLGVPSEAERNEIFRFLIEHEKEYKIRNDVKLQTLALQSAGLTPRDLISIFKKAKSNAFKRLSGKDKANFIDVGNGGVITLVPGDFEVAINEARNQFSDLIGAPKIPDVKWEDIGGLDVVKDEILDTIDMPLKYPELFNNGLKKRSGILFYGPPGTGKTLLAKAIATNFSLNFFSVKGPELLNMYIGESEANVRRVFQKARDAKPCVIFFDELDSVAPKRGNQGDSGGVMDRIVSQLLAELDGMSGGDGGDGVFVVGATNRPDLLDEALLRPGRYDKMLYLGISDANDKQVKILEALTRKFKLGEDVDLNRLAESCTFNFTGADFYALCSDSMLNAMTRIANGVDQRIKDYNSRLEEPVSTRWWFDNVATEEDTDVVVTMEDFFKARNELSPSVSADELAHYLRIKANFEGGKQDANGSAAHDTGSNGTLHINGSSGSNGSA